MAIAEGSVAAAAAVACMRSGEAPMPAGERREWELRALARKVWGRDPCLVRRNVGDSATTEAHAVWACALPTFRDPEFERDLADVSRQARSGMRSAGGPVFGAVEAEGALLPAARSVEGEAQVVRTCEAEGVFRAMRGPWAPVFMAPAGLVAARRPWEGGLPAPMMADFQRKLRRASSSAPGPDGLGQDASSARAGSCAASAARSTWLACRLAGRSAVASRELCITAGRIALQDGADRLGRGAWVGELLDAVKGHIMTIASADRDGVWFDSS